MTSPKIERALVSVSDKTGLVEFARGLVSAGVEIYASGGSRRHLEEAGVPVREVAAYTGFPEMMDGRIKTLHPKIHGGILCRRDRADDMASIAEQGIVPFELVVVNLYPFKDTAAREGVTMEEAIEQIDVGGPTLIRAAAKNHAFVTVVCEPIQYERILKHVGETGATSEELRCELAGRAFAHTAEYDGEIALNFDRWSRALAGQKFGRNFANKMVAKAFVAFLVDKLPASQDASKPPEFADELMIEMCRESLLRYGENPHQLAALYSIPDAAPNTLACAEQLHGKELSYNNYLDLDSALAIARSLPQPGVVVIKHSNPCGAATGNTLADVMPRAWAGDPVSAFGSVLGFNAPVDAAAAEFLAEPDRFVEAIVAPDFTPDAFDILTTKPKWKANVRLLTVGEIQPVRGQHELRQISGGMLCQTADDLPDDETEWKTVTEAQVSAAQLADLRFAWAVCRHVKSNAIVLAKNQALVGVGAGQMSRVDAVEIAIEKASDRARGAALASDAFFPFDDSIHRAAEAGVTAVIQPGGSRRDDEVIAACNKHGIPMVFTGRRHFRH